MEVVEVESHNHLRLCIPPPNSSISSASKSPRTYREDTQQCIQVLSLDMVHGLSYFSKIPAARIMLVI